MWFFQTSTHMLKGLKQIYLQACLTQTDRHTCTHVHAHTHNTDNTTIHTRTCAHALHTRTCTHKTKFLTFTGLYQNQLSTPHYPNISIWSVVGVDPLVFYLCYIFLPLHHSSKHCMHTRIQHHSNNRMIMKLFGPSSTYPSKCGAGRVVLENKTTSVINSLW